MPGLVKLLFSTEKKSSPLLECDGSWTDFLEFHIDCSNILSIHRVQTISSNGLWFVCRRNGSGK